MGFSPSTSYPHGLKPILLSGCLPTTNNYQLTTRCESYSQRSATIGSTLAALRAGSQDATIAMSTTVSTPAA